MKILIFKKYMHHRMHYEFSFLPHDFYVWGDDSELATWWFPGVRCPTNFHYVPIDKGIGYDIAMVGTIEQAELVRSIYPSVPIIACIGSGLYTDHPFSQKKDLIYGVVFSAYRCSRQCQNNKIVIRRAYNPERLQGYKGDVPLAITVMNCIQDRTNIYDRDFTMSLLNGYPHVFIGLNNEHLGDSIGHVDYKSITWFYRHCRILIYCPVDDDAIGPSAVVPEAMMTGMPVAVTPFADWPDILTAGGVVSHESGVLSRFIQRCMRDRDYAIECGQEGQKIAVKLFGFERYKRQWEELLNAVIKGSWIEDFS